jgi:serine O-acetyltransferase
MDMELSRLDLIAHVQRQLMNMFGTCGTIEPYLDKVLYRVINCFKVTKDKYYKTSGRIYFSPFHSGQYSIFLYYLANTIFRSDSGNELATKIY